MAKRFKRNKSIEKCSAPEEAPAPDVLSRRELQVARRTGNGLTRVQIASELSISPETVKTYLVRTQVKLGLKRYQLSLYLIYHGLLPRYDKK